MDCCAVRTCQCLDTAESESATQGTDVPRTAPRANGGAGRVPEMFSRDAQKHPIIPPSLTFPGAAATIYPDLMRTKDHTR